MPAEARARVGIGGWNFEPWRSNFYPPGWPHARELEYASRQLGTIEINSTFYSLQKPATFARWRTETPDDFVFSLKATRYSTHRRVLAEAAESVERFIGSGISELGPKLGPIVWQFAPTKRFDPADFAAFLELLPKQAGGLPLRHAIEARHTSFLCAEYLALAREHGVATVFTASPDYPSFADLTGDFAYVRLMHSDAALPEGYPPSTLDALATCVQTWQRGGEPPGVPRVQPSPAEAGAPRDVFFYFIGAAKEKNPAAAMALTQRLSGAAPATPG